jgi:predicted MFS family arabinose efflux permease
MVAWRCLPADDRPARTRGLDLPGACTITAAIGTLTYAIVGVEHHPWTSAHTLGSLALAAALLAAFVWIESSTAAHPLVPLRIFRQRQVVVANLIALIIGASMFGVFYYLSLDLQGVAHDTPLMAGLAFLPAGLATFASAVLAPRTVAFLGIRRQLALGAFLVSAGSLWLSDLHAGAPYATHILGPLLLCGVGWGISFFPMTLAATADVPPEEAGLVAGLVNTSRQLGGALGLAAAGAIVAASVAPADPTPGYTAAWRFVSVAVLAAVALCALLPGRQPAAS